MVVVVVVGVVNRMEWEKDGCRMEWDGYEMGKGWDGMDMGWEK